MCEERDHAASGTCRSIFKEKQQSMVTAWLDENVYQFLSKFAESERLSRGTVLRWFVDAGLKK